MGKMDKVSYREIDEKLNVILNPTADNILEFTKLAERFGQKNLAGLSSTKLRQFYDYCLKIKDNLDSNKDWFVNFALLSPKIAYNIGKEKGNQSLKDLKYLIDKIIDKLNAENNIDNRKKMFLNFLKFFEAVVAYHRIVRNN